MSEKSPKSFSDFWLYVEGNGFLEGISESENLDVFDLKARLETLKSGAFAMPKNSLVFAVWSGAKEKERKKREKKERKR